MLKAKSSSPPLFQDGLIFNVLFVAGPIFIFQISRRYFTWNLISVYLVVIASLGPAIVAHCTAFIFMKRRYKQRQVLDSELRPPIEG
jgi:hypothetical protein